MTHLAKVAELQARLSEYRDGPVRPFATLTSTPETTCLGTLVDDLVDIWHATESSAQALHEFIGMTEAEYATWVKHDELPASWVGDARPIVFDPPIPSVDPPPLHDCCSAAVKAERERFADLITEMWNRSYGVPPDFLSHGVHGDQLVEVEHDLLHHIASELGLLEAAGISEEEPDMRDLYAITVQPPWPWWIATDHPLAKDVENRGWRPRKGVAEDGSMRLAIHAGMGKVEASDAELYWYLKTMGWSYEDAILSGPRGCIVAVVTARFTRESRSRWAMPDQWHWELSDKAILPEPVSCKGSQGLWRVPADVLSAVEEQMRLAREVA